MVDEEELYDVVWTPLFAEEVRQAADYIQNHLMMPLAARDFLDGVMEALENRRRTPTAAIRKISPSGTEFYVAHNKQWAIYYLIEGRTIKAVSLKHRLQR